MAEIDLTQFDGHTAGPWRWEYNAEHRSVHVVGGRPLHDLTVMDFARWGMGGATPVFRDVAEDGMNIMHKLNSRPDWVAPFKGRQHHARWCSAVVHPDAILMAAAPALLAEVKRQAEEIERLRGALNTIARHFDSSWPEWCQENVFRASVALLEQK